MAGGGREGGEADVFFVDVFGSTRGISCKSPYCSFDTHWQNIC